MGEIDAGRCGGWACDETACAAGPCRVLASLAGTGPSEDMLAAFCEASWSSVRAFVCAQGYRGAEAEDLTQAYFTRFLERGDLAYAARWKGCLRGFLWVSVRHFLSNQRDRERALKRGGGVRPLSLDAPRGERGAVPEPATSETPETLLARSQAEAAMRAALDRLRQEMLRAGLAQRLARVESYLLSEVRSGSYGRIAQEWGVGESAARVTVHRLRKRLAALLRAALRPKAAPEPRPSWA